MSDHRHTQAEMILRQLEIFAGSRTEADQWCPLPCIMALGIACYTRRISDLRKRGHVIECRKEYVDGQMRTAYRLVGKLGQEG
jgi:hypothetical protein